MKSGHITICFVLLFLLIVACAPQIAPAPAPASQALAAAKPVPAPAAGAPASVAPVKPEWEVKWEQAVVAAKKEGKLVIAITSGPEVRAALAKGFHDAFGISTEAISAKGAQLAEKIISEQRAGLYSYDIHIGGSSNVINQLKPARAIVALDPYLILPDLTDPNLVQKAWYGGDLYWIDKEQRTTLSFIADLNDSMAINTNLVKPGDIKSYRDLLQPKWKGKVILNDPTVAGVAQSLLAFAYYVLGWDYMVELAKAEPLIIRDERLMMQWLAQGKYAVVMPPKSDQMTYFMQAGAPVKGLTPVEGTWLGGKMLNVLTKVPHPNVAKVYVNWLLSKEGQTLYTQAAGQQSAREDIPTDFLPPEILRQPGMKYFVKEREEVILGQPELGKKAQALLAPLMQK